jgi:hypothetical protein
MTSSAVAMLLSDKRKFFLLGKVILEREKEKARKGIEIPD